MKRDEVLTAALELTSAALVALFLYAIFAPAALLPFAAVAGLMAWSRR